MPKLRKGLLAAVPERDFLWGHKVVEDAHEQTPAEKSMERTMGILCTHFDRKSQTPARIMIRMQALIEILDLPLMKAWKAEGLPNGGVLLHETVFRVAARHPITVSEETWSFEPDSFLNEVLRRSKRAGRA